MCVCVYMIIQSHDTKPLLPLCPLAENASTHAAFVPYSIGGNVRAHGVVSNTSSPASAKAPCRPHPASPRRRRKIPPVSLSNALGCVPPAQCCRPPLLPRCSWCPLLRSLPVPFVVFRDTKYKFEQEACGQEKTRIEPEVEPSALEDYHSSNAGRVGRLSANDVFYLCTGEESPFERFNWNRRTVSTLW